MKKKIFFVVLGLLIAGGSVWYIFNGGKDTDESQSAGSNSSQNQSNTTEQSKDSLVVVIDKQKSTKIFNDLLTAAGIHTSLQESDAFTVLAPSDEAFKSLPDGMLETLKKPENKEMLTAILNYHIIKGKLTSADIEKTAKLPTVNGQEVIVQVKDNKMTLVSAKGDVASIEKADIPASNGTLQVITAVLLPQ